MGSPAAGRRALGAPRGAPPPTRARGGPDPGPGPDALRDALLCLHGACSGAPQRRDRGAQLFLQWGERGGLWEAGLQPGRGWGGL